MMGFRPVPTLLSHWGLSWETNMLISQRSFERTEGGVSGNCSPPCAKRSDEQAEHFEEARVKTLKEFANFSPWFAPWVNNDRELMLSTVTGRPKWAETRP